MMLEITYNWIGGWTPGRKKMASGAKMRLATGVRERHKLRRVGRMRSVISLVLAVLLVLLVSACGGGSDGSDAGDQSVPQLQSIKIVPASSAQRLVNVKADGEKVQVPKGLAVQFVAMGTYSDGSEERLVGDVATWSIKSEKKSNTVVAGVDKHGRLIAQNIGTATLEVTADNGETDTLEVAVTKAALQKLSISPTDQGTLPAGVSRQLTAKATYTDGNSKIVTDKVSWSSSLPSLAPVNNNGKVTASKNLDEEHLVTITAQYSGLSDTEQLTVTDAQLTNIVISPGPAAAMPPGGYHLPFSATGIFSDGTKHELTDVTWNSSKPEVASIDDKGVVTSKKLGNKTNAKITEISATKSNSSGEMIKSEQPVKLQVSKDIRLDAIEVSMTVGDSQKSTTEIALGQVGHFSAVGIFKTSSGNTRKWDISDYVTWKSKKPKLLGINADSGKAIPKKQGEVLISAASDVNDAVPPGEVLITVNDAELQKILIDPKEITLPKGFEQQLTATGIYSDGSKEDITNRVTWVSKNTNHVIVLAPGRVQADRVGKAKIIAKDSQQNIAVVSEPATVTVNKAQLTGITVSPKNKTVYPGAEVQYTATGHFDAEPKTLEITKQVTWSVSDTKVATVDDHGLVTVKDEIRAHNDGVTITATTREKPRIADNTQLQVVAAPPPQIKGIDLRPVHQVAACSKFTESKFKLPAGGPVKIPQGFSVQLKAMAKLTKPTLSGKTEKPVTDKVTWTSQAPEVVKINNSGLITATGPGTTIVEASLSCSTQADGQCDRSYKVTVPSKADGLAFHSIQVESTGDKTKGVPAQFCAIGLFGNAENRFKLPITAQVIWSASESSLGQELVNIRNDAGHEGQASPASALLLSETQVVISAKHGDVKGTKTIIRRP